MTRPTTFRLLFLLAAVGVVFFMRMPSYSNSFCDPDLSDNYAAMLLLAGRCPYANAVMPEPPGTIFLYALNFLLFGYQMLSMYLIAAAWCAASVLLLYLVGKQTINPAAGLAAAGMYAFYQADIMAAGCCPNYEFWTLLPAIACLLLVGGPQPGRWRLFGAGVAACLGVSIKQPAGLYVLAGAALILLRAKQTAKDQWVATGMRRLGWYAAGGAACVLLFVAAMAPFSCVKPMAEVLNPLQLRGYLTSYSQPQRWSYAAQQTGRFLRSDCLLLAWLALAVVATAVLPRFRALLKAGGGAGLFLLAAVGAALAGGHFYGHYFAVLLPFSSLAVALFFGGIVKLERRGLTALAAVLLIGSTMYDSWPEIKLASASTSGLVRTGSVLTASIFEANRQGKIEPGTETEFIDNLEWQPTLRQVADYMRANLRPGQKIWTYDYFGELYFFTRAFAPTSHQVNFDVVSSANYAHYGLWHNSLDERVRRNRAQLMADLIRDSPQFIIRQTYDCRDSRNRTGRLIPGWPINIYGRPMAYCPTKMELFPELATFLAARYRLVEPPVNPDIDLYRLIESR